MSLWFGSCVDDSFRQNHLRKSALKVKLFSRGFRLQTGHQKHYDCCRRASHRLSTFCECQCLCGQTWQLGIGTHGTSLLFPDLVKWMTVSENASSNVACLPQLINSTPRGWFGTGLWPIWWNSCWRLRPNRLLRSVDLEVSIVDWSRVTSHVIDSWRRERQTCNSQT